MKLPANIEKRFSQFDSLTLRERALLGGAALIALVMIWTIAVFDRQHAKERFLLGDMETINSAIATAGQSMTELTETDPTTVALDREKKLQADLKVVNEQLASRSGGLIEPERMVQVIHDVLLHQHGVTLISLQNKAVTSLIQAPVAPAEGQTEETTAEREPTASTQPQPAGGPYVHTVELVVEGQYLDILDYLRALEALPWRFNWKVLELHSQRYPLNHVTIELTTLSMDKDWIGV